MGQKEGLLCLFVISDTWESLTLLGILGIRGALCLDLVHDNPHCLYLM